MTPQERAEYIVERYRKSIISNKKEDLQSLIAYHIEEAEKAAVAHYKVTYKSKAEALVKARAARKYVSKV